MSQSAKVPHDIWFEKAFILGSEQMKDLYSILEKCTSEEEVKHEFSNYFKFTLDTRDDIDLYTESILFEFKYDVNMSNVYTRSKVLAQALYYIRRLKYGNDGRIPSNYICGVDKNEAFIIKTSELKEYYYSSKKADKYDWDLKPSSPDRKLVNDLSQDNNIKNLFVYKFADVESLDNFKEKIHEYRAYKQISLFDDKKEITEYNFYPIYLLWEKLFGEYVENGRKSSEYFITDIEQGRTSILGDSQVLFRMNSGENITKYLPIANYNHFWDTYSKVQEYKLITSIRQKMDRMTEIEYRRFTGEFFTPLSFAEKAIDYIYRVIGRKCWSTGKYRLWDMAAGTGNLEYNLPAEAMKYCYISTILDDDVEYCKKIYPDATVFQYDFLNDDVNFIKHPELQKMGVNYKMPKNLVDDLKDPNITWILFFNPPWVTSNNNERKKDNINKDNVSMTEIQKIMTEKNLGETSRELVSQFLYRISIEFSGKKTYLALFSKIKYINSTNDNALRNKVFQYKYEKGFIFSSRNFNGCKQAFPAGFIIWNLSEKKSIEKQKIVVDVYDDSVDKIGTKEIKVEPLSGFLSKWIKRERTTKVMPPLSSAIVVADKNKDKRDRIAEGFLASFMCNGNDYAHQNYTCILSAPYVSAGALSITPNNFEQAMIVSVVRRLPKATWLNDRDQMFQPNTDVLADLEFISDCVVWALFSSYNDTVSLKDIKYSGNTYRIPNSFFPFLLQEIKTWNFDNEVIKADVYAKHEDRFVALWLNNHKLTDEGQAVLNCARSVYKIFFQHINDVPWPKYKIRNWDVGWWQIRMALNEAGIGYELLNELKENHKQLGEKILRKIYQYGFIQPDMAEI